MLKAVKKSILHSQKNFTLSKTDFWECKIAAVFDEKFFDLGDGTVKKPNKLYYARNSLKIQEEEERY